MIQNAAQHPDYCAHPAARFGLNRYLGVPIRSPQGDPIGTLCFLDNKTDQPLDEADVRFLSLLAMRVSAEVERERALQARVEEHRTAAEQLRALNARLEATAEEKRRFVAMVIHDLRHPLTALQTVLYLLREETDPEERHSYIEALENRVQALTNLLDALRQYNEIEAGRIRLHIERVNLAALITECVAGFAPAFIGETVRFECEVAPDLGFSQTDGGKLTHILLNLLANALKFTPRGTVWVRARRDKARRWVLEVEDTGIGMSAEEQKHVFEEFYRAPDAAERRGSGLGLAIVRQLCGAMQATITVSSAPHCGTCFRLTFPRRLKNAKSSNQDKQA